MKKIKYLTPILGLTALVGFATPIVTSCAKADGSKILPINLLDITGETLNGVIKGTDLTKYDTIEIPEGVKYINYGAFSRQVKDTNATMAYEAIKTIKLPASLRLIEEDAFAGLRSLSKIDITSWDIDTIHNIEIEDEAFGDDHLNSYRYCNIAYAQGLTAFQEKLLKEKLTYGGCPIWWFTALSTGHLGLTQGVEKEKNAICTSKTYRADTDNYALTESGFSITLAQSFDSTKYELHAFLEKTSSKQDYDMIEFDPDTEAIIWESPTQFSTAKIWAAYSDPMKGFSAVAGEGDDINFDINFVCSKKGTDEVEWVQKVEGFTTLINVQHATNVIVNGSQTYQEWLSPTPENLSSNQYTLAPYDVEVLPRNAINTKYEIVSGDPSVVSIVDPTASALTLQNKMIGKSELIFKSTDPKSAAATSVAVTIQGISLEHTSTALGSHVGGTSATDQYGYTIPAGADVTVQYKVTLDSTGIDMFTSKYSAANKKYRTFAVYQNMNDGSGYKNHAVRPSAVSIDIERSGSDPIHLYENQDYTMFEGKYIAMKDADANPFVFKANDEITFTFKFNSDNDIEFTGFQFSFEE